jgi:hypothetical protein
MRTQRLTLLAIYDDVPVERGGILKVVMAATQWLRDSQTNIFISNPIHGSGMKEVAAEGWV